MRLIHHFILILVSLFSMASLALEPSQREESLEFQSVVSIAANDVDAKGEEATAYCVGTLLSPHHLITAAHCVRGNVVLKENNLQVKTGFYKYVTDKSGQLRRIGYVENAVQKLPFRAFFVKSVQERIQKQGARANIGPNEDVVLVEFLQPVVVDQSFQFAKLITQNDLKGLLPKVLDYWPTVVTINFIEEMSLDTKRSGRLDKVKINSGGHIESKSTVRVEPGDSGSPLFVRIGSQWYLAGITKGRAETIFSNWDVYGLLDNKICDLVVSSRLKSRCD
ncbi:MAG: trypsin-like serine protease [Bdellovibrionia bacterium]